MTSACFEAIGCQLNVFCFYVSNYFVWFGKLIESDVFICASFGWSERTGGGFIFCAFKNYSFYIAASSFFIFWLHVIFELV